MLCESWRVWRSQVSNHKAIRNDIWSIWEWSKVIWRGIWARFEPAYEKTTNNNSEWYICGLRVLISNVRQRGLQIDRVLFQNQWDWILGDLEMTYKRSASHGDAKWAYLRPEEQYRDHLGVIRADLKADFGAIWRRLHFRAKKPIRGDMWLENKLVILKKVAFP